MSIETLTFTIPGTPIPWQRAARGGGRTFNTAKHEEYKRHAWVCAFAALHKAPRKVWPMVGSRFELVIGMYFPDLCTRDDDNVEKMLKDAFKGLLWDDDRWTRFRSVMKTMDLDAERPRCEVHVIAHPSDLKLPPKKLRLPKMPQTKRGR